MKVLISFLLFPVFIFGQIGINTTNPQATLDVEGNLRISLLENGSDTAAGNSILVVDDDNIVRLVAAQDVFKNTERTLISGGFLPGPPHTISLNTNEIIPFDSVDFDLKNEFDTTTHEFTATESGIYKVSAHIHMPGNNRRIHILKVNPLPSYAETLIFHGIGDSSGSAVTQTSKLIQLDAGERIRFRNGGGSGTVNIPSAVTFFSIEQVR